MPVTSINKIPLISVIMPVYNAEAFLKASIESILNQTYPNFEFLIFDDGSTDQSKEIIKTYAGKDPRIKPFFSPRNMGYVHYLNYGIENVLTKYIARMDADDISHPERFKLQVELMENHQDVVACGSYRILINEYGEESKNPHPMFVENLDLKVQLLSDSCFTHSSIMMRTSVLVENKLTYDYKAPCEDYGLWVKLAGLGKLENIAENLLKYRIHSSQITGSKTCDPSYKEYSRKVALKSLLDYDLSADESALWNCLFLDSLTLTKDEIKALSSLIKTIRINFKEQYGFNKQFDEFLKRRWFYVCTMSTHIGLWIFFFYFWNRNICFNGSLILNFFGKSLLQSLGMEKYLRLKK